MAGKEAISLPGDEIFRILEVGPSPEVIPPVTTLPAKTNPSHAISLPGDEIFRILEVGPSPEVIPPVTPTTT